MSLREFLGSLDKTLLVLVAALALLGLVNLYSASQASRPSLPYLQLAYLAVGFALALGIAAIETRWFEQLAYPFYLLVNFLLLLVLVVGTAVKGSQRWLNLGFMNLQPSEVMKLAIIFATARYLSRRQETDSLSLRDLVRPLNLSRPLALIAVLVLKYDDVAIAGSPGWTSALRVGVILIAVVWLLAAGVRFYSLGLSGATLVAPIDLLGLPAVLILVEPDLGTTLITLAIAGAIILFVGVRWISLLLLALGGVVGAVVAWFKVLMPYQQQRVLTFLNPEADALGAGYHANQSMIAIGSGGVQGKGFMEGTQTQLSFLPENSTDFVFSVLAEEWGLFGAVVLITLMTALLIKGLQIASVAKDRFAALVAIGVTALIFWQTLVNIGMVTGLMPVVGVTLPFMSYGGSSTLTVMTGIGLWLSISRRRSSM